MVAHEWICTWWDSAWMLAGDGIQCCTREDNIHWRGILFTGSWTQDTSGLSHQHSVTAVVTFAYKYQNFLELLKLCKHCLDLLMGRIYTKHATSYSWRRIYAKRVLHQYTTLTLSSWEGFMQKSKGVPLCNWLWISSPYAGVLFWVCFTSFMTFAQILP